VTQGFDTQPRAAGVQDTDHDLFAEQRGQGADAEVDHPVGTDLELHLAVLRHALFGDVHARDDLDPRGQLVLDGDRRRSNLPQLAIDAEAYPVVVLVRL